MSRCLSTVSKFYSFFNNLLLGYWLNYKHYSLVILIRLCLLKNTTFSKSNRNSLKPEYTNQFTVSPTLTTWTVFTATFWIPSIYFISCLEIFEKKFYLNIMKQFTWTTDSMQSKLKNSAHCYHVPSKQHTSRPTETFFRPSL